MSLNYTDSHDDINFEVLRQDLIADDFHNGRSTAQLETSFRNSQVVVYVLEEKAKDGKQRCIATARALSDGVCNCYIVDVWTLTQYRKQNIASEMMRRIIAAVPGQHIYLQSDDSVEFYKKLGFEAEPEGLSLVSGDWLGG